MSNQENKIEYLSCPIRQVISHYCDKWSMLVIYSLHTSENGTMRYNELRRHMEDCSQKMLSQTLRNLEQGGLVQRTVYPKVPPRVEYSLTDKGISLVPSITSLIDWAKINFGTMLG